MLNRRQFLGSILALAAAPAIVRASSLMKVPVRQTQLFGAAYDLGGPESLVMYDAAGMPLVSMPIAFNLAKNGLALAKQAEGVVMRTGVAHMFKLLDSGAQELLRGDVGGGLGAEGALLLNTQHLSTGCHVVLSNFSLGMGADLGNNIKASTALRNAMLDGAWK